MPRTIRSILYTRLAGQIELFDYGVVEEAIDLCNDPGSKTGAGMLGFSLNQSYEVIPQVQRRQYRVMKFLRRV